jgi:hypothetical protein
MERGTLLLCVLMNSLTRARLKITKQEAQSRVSGSVYFRKNNYFYFILFLSPFARRQCFPTKLLASFISDADLLKQINHLLELKRKVEKQKSETFLFIDYLAIHACLILPLTFTHKLHVM